MKNLFFEQKKGDPNRLDGRMIAYILVEGSAVIPNELKGVIHEGGNVFAVQADCRQEHSVDDFFKSEVGSHLKKGLDQVIQRLRESGLWHDQTDPNASKEDMDIIHGMAELIPIMARIVSFENEEEVLRQEGDVYYLGEFNHFQAASMCAQAFSLLYQFRYREQERSVAKREIDELLVHIESQVPLNENFKKCQDDLEKKLLGTYVPAILYSRHNEMEHKKAIERFRKFMEGYRFPEDIEEIINVSDDMKDNDPYEIKRLGLLLDKVIALCKEDFNKVAEIQENLRHLKNP